MTEQELRYEIARYSQVLNNTDYSEEEQNEARREVNRLQEILAEAQKNARKRTDKVQAFKSTTEQMNRLYETKNADYGDSFGESVREFGAIAGLVRISDKFNRLKTLLRGNAQQVQSESVEDTLMDLANYAIMLRMELTHTPNE
jgi:cysteinyl-tRNA synthetase